MANPVGNSDSLIEAVEAMGVQRASPGGVYEDSQKVYIQLGAGNRYVAKVGKEGKAGKGIKADKLTETIKKTIEHARSTLTSKTSDELASISNGLIVLRNRIQNAREQSWFAGILNCLGIKSGYDHALENVESSLVIIQDELGVKAAAPLRLKNEIQGLERQQGALRANLAELEKELRDLKAAAPRAETQQAVLSDDIEREKANLVRLEQEEREVQKELEELANSIAPFTGTGAALRSPEARSERIEIQKRQEVIKRDKERAQSRLNRAISGLESFHQLPEKIKTTEAEINQLREQQTANDALIRQKQNELRASEDK